MLTEAKGKLLEISGMIGRALSLLALLEGETDIPLTDEQKLHIQKEYDTLIENIKVKAQDL